MKKELNLFIVFEAIMRTGSVAKAAESLCLSSSAVSQSLTRLRDKHNEPLFVRESRGLTPTSYALKLYDSIQDPLNTLVMNLERQPKFSLNSDVKRVFKIATTSDVELLFLDKLISRIQEQNVGVEVVFHLDEEEVKRALRLRQVDFIVTLTKIEELSFLNTKLAEERIVVAAAENHPRLQGEMTKDDFFSEKHYVWNVGENGEKKNRDTYAAREVIGMNLGDREVVYKGSVLNLLFLTAETENICILSEKLFDKATKRMTGLQKIKFPFETKSFPIYAISHKSYENDEGALWLRNEIKDILSQI